MKLFKGLLLVGVIAIAACKKSQVSQNDENFSEPLVMEESIEMNGIGGQTMVSNFDSIPSAESISNVDFIPDRISFEFDRAEVSPSQKEILEAQVNFIKANLSDTKKIRISGYCDERGSIEYNYALGEKRANAVKKFYVKMGIPAKMIESISYGKEVVLVEGSFDEAYKQNRVGKVSLCETSSC